jgi:hypothetical protein
MSGCSEDTEPMAQPLKVVSVNPPGEYIASNAVITVTFSNVMESVEINVLSPPLHHCVKSFTTLQGRIATWHTIWPGILVPAEEVTLTVTGIDTYGQKLEEFTAISFRYYLPDCAPCTLCMPPHIVGKECDPEDGAVGVNPKKYSDKIAIVFSEKMGHVGVVTIHPKFPFTEILDGEILTISFIDGYVMPYDTKFTIELSGADLAGNPMVGEYDLEKCEYKPREYSFTTMARGGISQ